MAAVGLAVQALGRWSTQKKPSVRRTHVDFHRLCERRLFSFLSVFVNGSNPILLGLATIGRRGIPAGGQLLTFNAASRSNSVINDRKRKLDGQKSGNAKERA